MMSDFENKQKNARIFLSNEIKKGKNNKISTVRFTEKSFNSTCVTKEQCENKYRCIDNICRCTQAEYLNGTQCLSSKEIRVIHNLV